MLLSKKVLIFVSIALIFSMESFFVFKGNIFAGTEEGEQIFISEVKVGGESANDEFVELYNPNSHYVDLKKWQLKKTTKSGSEGNILSDIEVQIPANGFLLIVPREKCGDSGNEKCYLGDAQVGHYYSTDNYLADDNSVILYDNSVKGVLREVDKVGWGNIIVEGKTAAYPLKNLSAGESWARKIVDGKMQDTGNDAEDFIRQSVPTPQNSLASGGSSNENGNDSSGSDTANDGTANGESGSASENSPGTNTNMNQEDASGSGADNADSGTDAGSGGTVENAAQNSGNQDESLQNAPQSGSLENNADSGQPAEKKMIINEMLINPEGDDGKLEFIELYNKGKDAADISGWSLEDLAGKVTGKFIFAKGTVIGAGKYEVFYSSDTKLSLNNSGDGAVLKDGNGKIIFKTPVSGAAAEENSYALDKKSEWVWTVVPTPGSENVIKEKEDKSAKDNSDKNKTSGEGMQKSGDTGTEEGAKGQEQESVSENKSYDFSDKVIINEIFSDPPGRDNEEGNYEWVEIFNGDDRAVNLKGWFVDDVLDKGSKPFRFEKDTVVPAQGYLVLSSEESKLLLNNSDEEINLLWPDRKVADSASYDKATENSSYSLSATGAWFWTETVTPGKENAPMPPDADKKLGKKKAKSEDFYENSSDFTEKEDEDQPAAGEVLGADTFSKEEYVYTTIAEAKKMPLGAKVGVDGIVATPPGIFGKDIFYLASKDSSEGLQMFSYGGNIPALNLGDRVQVFGFMSQSGGEKRLVLNDNFQIEKMGGDNLLNAAPVRAGEAGENILGNLAKIEGVVSEAVSGNLIILGDDSGKIKIYAKPSTGISFSDIKPGTRLSVIGEVSRTSAGYRILPRFESDVRLLENGFDGIIEKGDTGTVSEKHMPSGWMQAFLILSFLIVLDWMRLRVMAKARRG